MRTRFYQSVGLWLIISIIGFAVISLSLTTATYFNILLIWIGVFMVLIAKKNWRNLIITAIIAGGNIVIHGLRHGVSSYLPDLQHAGTEIIVLWMVSLAAGLSLGYALTLLGRSSKR